MQVISKGEIFHRTKLMEAARAERFARCLMANEHFAAVSVEESPTAKSAKRCYVRYQPASDRRQADLVRGEMAARAQRAAEQAGNYLFVLDDSRRYFHCLNFESGEVYEVTERSCSCPDHTYRAAAVGACKHVRILRSGEALIRGWAQ